jgi:molybdopterin-guanine dinucleotide biosynthesis protein A
MVNIIILAGGESRRFYGNKLLSKLNGCRTIEKVFDAANAICKNVYISVNNREQLRLYSRIMDVSRDVFLIDSPKLPRNPLNPFLTITFERKIHDCLFIPGDIPNIDKDSLEKVSTQLNKTRHSVTTLIWGDGWMENTWLYIRDELPEEIYELYTSMRTDILRTRRPSDIIRITPSVCLYPIKDLDVDTKVFLSINTVDDLLNPKVRSRTDGLVNEPINYDYRELNDVPFYRAIKAFLSDNLDKAIGLLNVELMRHLRYNAYQLALHASKDMHLFLSLIR